MVGGRQGADRRGDPQAYITDVITRIVGGHPQSQIDELMPRNCLAVASRV